MDLVLIVYSYGLCMTTHGGRPEERQEREGVEEERGRGKREAGEI